MAYKTLRINNKELKIWPSDDGVCISDDGGWIDGVYDNEFTAIEVFKLTFLSGGWDRLSELNKKANKENRVIDLSDIRRVSDE